MILVITKDQNNKTVKKTSQAGQDMGDKPDGGGGGGGGKLVYYTESAQRMLTEAEMFDCEERWDEGVPNLLHSRLNRQLSMEEMFDTEENWDEGIFCLLLLDPIYLVSLNKVP